MSIPTIPAMPVAAVEPSEEAVAGKALYENHRQVLLGQVLVNLGVGEAESVFPKGLPEGLPAAPVFAEVASIVRPQEASYVDRAFAALVAPFFASGGSGAAAGRPAGQTARPSGTPVFTPTGQPSALGPMPVAVAAATPPPQLPFGEMSPDTIRAAKKVVDPVDGTIKRLRGLAIDREEQLEIGEIPCRELSGKVYRCYHKAHTDALRRFEAEGGEESTWPAFRTVEVLGCEGVVQDFLECAGKARSAFISAQPISAA